MTDIYLVFTAIQIHSSFDDSKEGYDNQLREARRAHEKLSSLYQKSTKDLAMTYESSVSHLNTLEKSLSSFIQDSFTQMRKKWVNSKLISSQVDAE